MKLNNNISYTNDIPHLGVLIRRINIEIKVYIIYLCKIIIGQSFLSFDFAVIMSINDLSVDSYPRL